MFNSARLIIAFLLVLTFAEFVMPDQLRVSNPAIMHMKRRDFIAAAGLQGLLTTDCQYGPKQTAKQVVAYTDALMEELDK